MCVGGVDPSVSTRPEAGRWLKSPCACWCSAEGTGGLVGISFEHSVTRDMTLPLSATRTTAMDRKSFEAFKRRAHE